MAGRGRADFGLAGLAALLFASIWPALRLRPFAGNSARRAALYVLFGAALAAGRLAVMLLIAAAARRLASAPAQAGANTPTQAFVMLLAVTTLPFLLARLLVALPGAVTALPITGSGWHTTSAGLTLSAAGDAVDAAYDPTAPASPGYFWLQHTWMPGKAAGGNGLRVRAQSDAELYVAERVTLADGSAYEAIVLMTVFSLACALGRSLLFVLRPSRQIR